MSTALALWESVVGFGVSGRRAISTTSLSDDFVESYAASERGSDPRDGLVFPLVERVDEEYAPAVARGRTHFLVTPPDRIGGVADAVATGSLPERFVGSRIVLLDSYCERPGKVEEDRLDWDAFIGSPPVRSHGTIDVTLSFAGRSKPLPVDDDWY